MEKTKAVFILINKQTGKTSHDVVDALRKITGIRRIGHAGTLDPFASGLLIVAVGRDATKKLNNFVKLDKEYVVEIELGTATDTHDRAGLITKKKSGIIPLRCEVAKTLKAFLGEREQVPPMFSAKKLHGQKLYELARQGIEVTRQAAMITIHELDLLSYDYPILTLRVRCSSGTYIRTLAHDIGMQLHTYAHAKELTRTKIGDFDLANAHQLSNLTPENWKTLSVDLGKN